MCVSSASNGPIVGAVPEGPELEQPNCIGDAMKHRPPRPEVDFSTWPTYDPAALSSSARKIFTARKKAVELYCANFTIQEIENQTGVNRRQVYRLIAACTQVHSDGRVYGYRALKPYVRIALYQRQTKPKRNPAGSVFGGAVGAF